MRARCIIAPGTLNKRARGRVPSAHCQDQQLRSASLISKLKSRSTNTHRNSWKQSRNQERLDLMANRPGEGARAARMCLEPWQLGINAHEASQPSEVWILLHFRVPSKIFVNLNAVYIGSKD